MYKEGKIVTDEISCYNLPKWMKKWPYMRPTIAFYPHYPILTRHFAHCVTLLYNTIKCFLLWASFLQSDLQIWIGQQLEKRKPFRSPYKYLWVRPLWSKKITRMLPNSSNFFLQGANYRIYCAEIFSHCRHKCVTRVEYTLRTISKVKNLF